LSVTSFKEVKKASIGREFKAANGKK
jgi:hypothetical protein